MSEKKEMYIDVQDSHGVFSHVADDETCYDGTICVQLDDGAYMPERAHPTDAGADLRTPEPFTLFGHSSHTVHTGVHVELPRGFYARLASKSGLNVLHDIVSEGVVDEGYSGEIMVRLHNLGKQNHFFARGDKVSQLIVEPVVYPWFREVVSVEGGARGDAGFGSTGR